MMRTIVPAVTICLAVLFVGCPKTVVYPETALEDYVQAVNAKKSDQVYSLLSDDLRQNLSKEDFADWFNENYDEIKEQADQLDAVLKKGDAPVEVVATLEIVDNDTADFVYTDGSWYLNDEVVVAVTAGEDELRVAALGFEEALANRDLEALLGVLSSEHAETIEAELNILVNALGTSHEKEFSIEGERAYIMLDGGIRVTFILEDGEWKVLDVSQDW